MYRHRVCTQKLYAGTEFARKHYIGLPAMTARSSTPTVGIEHGLDVLKQISVYPFIFYAERFFMYQH